MWIKVLFKTFSSYNGIVYLFVKFYTKTQFIWISFTISLWYCGSCVAVNGETEIFQISSKPSSFVFWRWAKVLRVWSVGPWKTIPTLWGQNIPSRIAIPEIFDLVVEIFWAPWEFNGDMLKKQKCRKFSVMGGLGLGDRIYVCLWESSKHLKGAQTTRRKIQHPKCAS